MRFRVTNQYAKGSEDPIAEFRNQSDAESFIAAKLNADATMKVKVMYRLYDSFDLVKEYAAKEHGEASEGLSSGAGSSAGGGRKGASFNPTPLNMTPSPTGLPKKWWKDEDEDEEK